MHRATFPKSLKNSELPLSLLQDFENWLTESLGKNFHVKTRAVQNVSRLLGFVKPEKNTDFLESAKANVEFLVSMMYFKIVDDLLKLPFLHPQYKWRTYILEALKLYCQYHLEALSPRMLSHEEEVAKKFHTILTGMVTRLDECCWLASARPGASPCPG